MSRNRCLIVLSFCCCASLPVGAQSQVPPPAADARPPALEVIDDSVQPEVTIRRRDGDVIEEFRRNGQLYKVVVTPAHGVPYTLIDPKGDGTLVPMESSGQQISVPLWEIGTF